MKNLYLYLVLLAGFFFCTAVEAQTNATSGTPIIYSVAKGDCLYNIARQHGLSTKVLYGLNKHQIKNPNLIRINQKLIIGYETITTNNQPATIDSVTNANMLVLPSATELSQLVPSLNLEIPLDKLYMSKLGDLVREKEVTQNFEEEVKTEKVAVSNKSIINRVKLSLVDKLKLLGIKCNVTPYIRSYTLRQIENNIRVSLKRNKLIYNSDKSFELSEDGTAMYLKHSDYNKLIWACYGLNHTLYECQDPKLIIEAEEMGMKYNTKEQYYSYEEIAQSMIDSLGRKKVIYADSAYQRFQFNGKRIWLDCSAFACFMSNLYGVKPVGQTTANIFAPHNGRRVVKSTKDLTPGDYVGKAGGRRSEGHVHIYLGNGMFAHSSGKLPLFINKDAVERKGHLYACTPSPNMELERIQNANGQSQLNTQNLAAVFPTADYTKYLKIGVKH